MSYTVSPYIVSIEELSKAIGSKDRNLTIAILKKMTAQSDVPFKENDFDVIAPKDDDDWDTLPAVKALMYGDLNNEKISGSQYGYALEEICSQLGEREFIESLESVHFSGDFDSYWQWLSNTDKPLIPYCDYNVDFPIIGYLPLADIPAEIQRTKELKFAERIKKSMDAGNMMNLLQLQGELEVFSDYEMVEVSPEDFHWLDESYYDSVQQELELLGFHKIRDEESLHLSRVFPETRHFNRFFVKEEENICASICQVRIVEPQNDEQRNIDIRCVEFTSEFSDGTFFITTNTLGVDNLENIEGIIFEKFLPNIPLKELLNYHRKSRETLQHSANKSEFRKNATLDDFNEAGKRQQVFMRADRQKKIEALSMRIVTDEEEVLNEELNEWLEEIRIDLLALYQKAVEAKKDIVTFYY
ncbi:MAG: hypothetical protein LBH59_09155 [Planctomycetaceae bacterium]|jgi:hypothetical protein|nr:hypothetical protein [Planctomycetaceae bacterium]